MHQAVQHEGDARHVARVFNHREGEEHAADDGNERADELYSPADAIGEEGGKPLRESQVGVDRPRALDEDGVARDIEEVDEGGSHVDGEHEHQVDDAEEDRKREKAIQDDGIYHVGQCSGHRRDPNGAFDQGVDVLVARKIGGVVGRGTGGIFCLGICRCGHFAHRVGDRVFQRVDAFPPRSDEGHDRATERPRQGCGIYANTVSRCDIRHVERDHDGYAQIHQLRRQVEAARNGRGIDDVDDDIRIGLLQVVARDLFVYCVSSATETVGARQVHDFGLTAAMIVAPGLVLYGYAGPVADALPTPREAVEYGRLAAVGIADDRDDGSACQRRSSSRHAASRGRSASRKPRK